MFDLPKLRESTKTQWKRNHNCYLTSFTKSYSVSLKYVNVKSEKLYYRRIPQKRTQTVHPNIPNVG